MTRNISHIKHRIIADPFFHVVLYKPEIPANTGSIARLCGATETRLHLIHPLGFRLDDKHLKRAGLDYWSEIDIVQHANFREFREKMGETGKLITFSTHAPMVYTKADVKRGDYLMFGPETTGLPSSIRAAYPCYTIPIWGRIRSLNLSTCVGIVLYHYFQELGRF